MATSASRVSTHDDDDDAHDGYWKVSIRGMSFNDEEEEARKTAHDFVSKNKDSLFEDDADTDSLTAITADNGPSYTPAVQPTALEICVSARNQPTSARSRAPSVREFKENHSDSGSITSVETTKPPGHQRSLSSVSANVVTAVQSQPTKAQVAKLEAKVKKLEWKLENQVTGRLSPEDTIKRIVLGQVYVLESFRSLEEKKFLLKLALNTHDGNTVNTVIGFLRQTLNKSIFQRCLVELDACDQYTSYLEQTGEVNEVEDILSMIGKSDEAAIRKYKSACCVSNIDNKVRQLNHCLKSHFELDPLLLSDTDHLTKQISLLQIQQIIEKADSTAEAEGRHPVMKIHRRTGTLPHQSLITTLFYCCLYHYNQPPNVYHSPQYLIQTFKINDLQFQWMAVSALSRIKGWNQIEQLFSVKKWHGKITLVTAIRFPNVVKILNKTKATPDIIEKYCSLINNDEERLHTAIKYKCHVTAVETLVKLKDRTELLRYIRGLSSSTDSNALHKARYSLENSSIKWVN